MVVETLLHLGLSKSEAEVYVANMQLGMATVQQIAHKAEMNRTTTYTHIRNLISRGLIGTRQKNGRQFFVAEKPDKLKLFWQQQEIEIQRRKETLEKVMPELESLYNLAAERPSVKLYDLSDIKKLREYVVSTRSDEFLNIFNYEMFKNFIDTSYIDKLLESTSQFKALYISDNKLLDKRLHRFNKRENFTIRYLPYKKFNFLCEILIGEKEVYINRENDSLIINDQIFSKTFKIVFNTLWQLSEEFNNN